MSTRTEYSDKLKDPRWQQRRLAIMDKRGWKCESCTCGVNDGRPFHVHHRYYVSGRSPWAYPDWAFVLLCEQRHSATHHVSKMTDEPEAWENMIDRFFDGQLNSMHPRLLMAYAYNMDDWLASERERKAAGTERHKAEAKAAGIPWE